jgi:antitoxin component YwqK of YwqJK toxin-antitoxin module
MKNLLLTIFLLSHLSLYAQTTSITAPGTIGVSCSEYVNNMNKTWNINIQTNRKLVLSYSVKVEHSYDKVLIYSIDDAGTAVLQATLTGSQMGTLESHYPNGKMRVVFTSDGSVNCSTNSTYTGFTINITQAMEVTEIGYYYDTSGNRINRAIVLELRSDSESDNFPDENEIVFREKETDIRIYPNPTKGQFVVEINSISNEASGEIHLYDTSGRILEKKDFRSGGKIDFDLSRQVAGVYVLNINIEGKISTWKVIKK